MSDIGDLWWWAPAAPPQRITLGPAALSLRPGPTDVALASEDRPTGITAKVFRGDDHRHPALVLTGARKRGGQWCLSGPGEGHMEMPNRHTDRNDVVCTDLVRFELDGRAVHQWVVTGQSSATRRPSPADEVTSMNGPGVLGLWAEAPIFPSLGVGRQPIERDRVWSWVSPSPIFDDTAWSSAHELTDGSTAWWSGVDNFPDGLSSGLGSKWIWGTPSSTTFAPGGDCYFRKTFTVAEAGMHTLYFVADDFGRVWVDGVELITTNEWSNSNEDLYVAQFDLSAGSHTIAVWASNNFGTIDGANPAGIRAVLCPTDSTGVVSNSPVVVTDSTWKVVSYPSAPPGMTVGEVLIGLLDEWQDLGFMTGWEVTFTETHDSNGAPWPVGEFGTKVGTDGRTFLLDELAQTYIDVRPHNGGLVLDACIIDTLGEDRDLVLEGPTGRDPATGNLTELTHERTGPRGTSALVLTQLGWQFVDATPEGERKRGVTLGLGAQPSTAAAEEVARGELEWMSEVSEAITAGFRPRSIAERPDRSCDVGDRVTVPSWDGTPSLERVLSWTFDEDEHGTITWAPELKSVKTSALERHEQALKKMADGTVRGASRVATPISSVATSDSTCCPPQPTGGG